MRHKFSFYVLISIIALSFSSGQAQSKCDDEEVNAQKRRQTTVRRIVRPDGIVVITRDAVPVPSVAVRPARPTRIPTVDLRVPKPPMPPMVERKLQNFRNGYAPGNFRTSSYQYSDRAENFGAFKRFETGRTGSVAQVARLNGYRDGQREGIRDARDGDSYNPFGEHSYRDGATGYISKYGDRQFYQQIYRQSFVRGYKESFDRYLGNDYYLP